MDELLTVNYNTGFSANVNNFKTSADDFHYFDGTSDKLSAVEIIKNEFFVIQENQLPSETSTQSLFKTCNLSSNFKEL